MKYITKDNETIDAICHQYYGTTTVVPQVYAANIHLAEKGVILPQGIAIELPDIKTETKKKPTIQLFG